MLHAQKFWSISGQDKSGTGPPGHVVILTLRGNWPQNPNMAKFIGTWAECHHEDQSNVEFFAKDGVFLPRRVRTTRFCTHDVVLVAWRLGERLVLPDVARRICNAIWVRSALAPRQFRGLGQGGAWTSVRLCLVQEATTRIQVRYLQDEKPKIEAKV